MVFPQLKAKESTKIQPQKAKWAGKVISQRQHEQHKLALMCGLLLGARTATTIY